MDADLIAARTPVRATLVRYGMLEVSGADARAFLHAQLSNDVLHQPADVARRAGYCSAKGRLLASFLVIPHEEGFLLQVAADLAAPIGKRLTMFVLRSKVKVADVSAAWTQTGLWGKGAESLLAAAGLAVPAAPMQVSSNDGNHLISLGNERLLHVGKAAAPAPCCAEFAPVSPDWWALEDVRAGVPLITGNTQDLFVPQMANFELIGGVDFRKGCYPGQEIVARSQYLGKLKRRMYRGEIDAEGAPSVVPKAGEDLFGGEAQAVGTLVGAAPRPQGGYELLAVLQSAQVDQGEPIRLGARDGPQVRIAPLPYAL